MQEILVERTSPYSVNTTVELIVAESERQNWKVPVVHDLQQTLARSGKNVMPVRVIELCKPDLAGSILELNHERSFSVFMPCRISVYAKEDGTTHLSVMNAEMMAAFIPGAIAVAMVEAAKGSLGIIDVALKS
jgi:uncharacterized protein (DUF302 family)